MFDYHLHSAHSGDGRDSIADLCQSALSKGFRYIAVTDHYDLGNGSFLIEDPEQYVREILSCREQFPALNVACGIELDYRKETFDQVRDLPRRLGLDFALLSLHFVDGVDTYFPEYFEGRTQHEAYALYLSRLLDAVREAQGSFVMSHLTYVSKFAPFEQPTLEYADYADLLEELLRAIVHKGFGLEINTSGLKNNAGLLPGMEIVRRYHQLGGEILTLGSDSHTAAGVGNAIPLALEAAKAAGFAYIAHYRNLEPIFMPV